MSDPSGTPNWRLGANHSADQWSNKMRQRGWTADQISEAIEHGQRHPAVNNINPPNGATRYVHPTIDRSVVLDDLNVEVLHLAGDGYVY